LNAMLDLMGPRRFELPGIGLPLSPSVSGPLTSKLVGRRQEDLRVRVGAARHRRPRGLDLS
jgi:hypothetical protein